MNDRCEVKALWVRTALGAHTIANINDKKKNQEVVRAMLQVSSGKASLSQRPVRGAWRKGGGLSM